MATISFNPSTTNSPQSSFLGQTKGFVQGIMMDDPVAFQLIRQGFVDSSVSGSVYAGMAITQNIPAIDSEEQGSNLVLATAEANISGWTIGNKLYNGIIVPGANVPVVVAGQTCSFAALGSGARIAVNCDTTLAASLAGGATNQQTAWDYTNQKLIAYSSGTALPVTVEAISDNCKIVNTSTMEWETGTCALIKI